MSGRYVGLGLDEQRTRSAQLWAVCLFTGMMKKPSFGDAY